ncbi:hypothetical protein [Paenisporosarcina cavernae]|nr:hypothetical protein [Paenisporosarcina cavernae]
MGWLILIVVAYAPIFYRIHRRLSLLENEVSRLEQENIAFQRGER